MSAHDSIFRHLDSAATVGGHIHPMAHIDPGVQLPPDVVIEAGAFIPANVAVEAGCRIGPNVAFVHGEPTRVKRGVVIGANATLYAGITIAANAVVRPGTVVTRSVPQAAIVEGNPAAIVGYVATQAGPASRLHVTAQVNTSTFEELPVHGVTLHHFAVIPDLRGSLTVGEFGRQIPFDPRRYFIVFGVPNREVRGEHAHRECHQFLLCMRGSCAVVADDGRQRVEVVLDAPQRGLYLPPMTWGIQYKYSPDAVLMVFASHHYDAGDYIREYDQFITEVSQ